MKDDKKKNTKNNKRVINLKRLFIPLTPDGTRGTFENKKCRSNKKYRNVFRQNSFQRNVAISV